MQPVADRAAAVLRSIDGLGLTPAPQVAPTGALAADLRAALDRSREAFRTLALDDAIREATSVVDRFPPSDGDGARLLREAFVRIAQAHQAAGRAADARAALARAAGIGLPDPIALTDFPPAVVDGYETEKRRLLALPRARLAIETDPVGAEILVDGVPAARTEDGAVEVLPTPHVVTARYAGRGDVSARVGAEGGAVRLALSAPEQGARSVRLEVASGAAGSVTLRLTARLDGAPFVLEESAPADEIEIAARRLGEALRDRVSPRPAMPPAVATTAAPSEHTRKPGPAPFYDRWWFWTAAGVAIVTGVAIASQATGSPHSDIYVKSN